MPRGRREVNPKIQVKGEEEEEGERRERERGTRPLPTEVKDLPPGGALGIDFVASK